MPQKYMYYSTPVLENVQQPAATAPLSENSNRIFSQEIFLDFTRRFCHLRYWSVLCWLFKKLLKVFRKSKLCWAESHFFTGRSLHGQPTVQPSFGRSDLDRLFGGCVIMTLTPLPGWLSVVLFTSLFQLILIMQNNISRFCTNVNW